MFVLLCLRPSSNRCFSILLRRKFFFGTFLTLLPGEVGRPWKLELLLDFCPKMVFSKKRDGEARATKCSFSILKHFCTTSFKWTLTIRHPSILCQLISVSLVMSILIQYVLTWYFTSCMIAIRTCSNRWSQRTILNPVLAHRYAT